MTDDFLNACPPPWQVFPKLPPEDLEAYLKQGHTEAWFDQVWKPFWTSLSEEQREQYLGHWSATPEWRDAMYIFTLHEEIDLKAEWAEFEERSRQRRAEEQPKVSLWKRLFGRRH